MLQAAKFQLLASDAIKQLSMVNEKVMCYLKAVEYYQNTCLNLKISSSFDIQCALTKYGKPLTLFLIKSCFDSLEAIKTAALKGLEFLFENAIGILELSLPILLKCLIMIYPYHDYIYL